MANEDDARLERLVAASVALLEANRQQGQQQRENHEQAMAEQRQRHEEAMARLLQLSQITERQADNIRSLTSAVAELARSVTAISKNQPKTLESSRRGTRVSEVTELLATRILEELREVRDAVDELREGRR